MQSSRQPITAIAAGVYSTLGLTKPTNDMDAVKEISDDFCRFVRHTAQRYNVKQDTVLDVIKSNINQFKI